ncbi:hypothetical protein EVA_07965 [gut metagenome]|uniref:Uncharacterized protein n=1 Tax=gut metagenome TaxID=749906 RepID=J9GNL8_9ZZZZ
MALIGHFTRSEKLFPVVIIIPMLSDPSWMIGPQS